MISIDGRDVVSRTALHDRYGYAVSSLERWWSQREDNGHPDIAHRIGNTFYWDAEQWEQWDKRRQQVPAGWATRAELADRTKVTTAELKRLWQDRDANGHPAPLLVDRVMHWDTEAWTRWHQALEQQQQDQRDPRTDFDRSGDPDELIRPAAVARVLNYNDTTTISHNVKHPPTGWPEPDSWEELPSGRQRPLWKRNSIWAYAEQRRHPGHAGGRKRGSRTLPHRYAEDPRLQLARDLLAEQPDARPGQLVEELQRRVGTVATPSTWLAILKTAREHPTDE